MMGNHLNSHLRCLLNIPHDGIQPAIPIGTIAQHDVLGIHSDSLERHPCLIAVVPHPLELIRIPGAVFGYFAYGRGEALYAMAQIVFKVCFTGYIRVRAARNERFPKVSSLRHHVFRLHFTNSSNSPR